MPREPLPISVVYRRIQRALGEEFSGAVLVVGEVRKLSRRGGHCYFELVEPGGGSGGKDAVLNVVCWSTTYQRVAARLAKVGVALEEGAQVVAGGALKTWFTGGRIQFELQYIDIEAMVGRLATARAEARAALEREGLLRANAGRPLAAVPLRIGLVASRDSEGFRDFLGVLERSRYGISVTWCHATVQGRDAARDIAAAIQAVHENVDVVAVVRGGGAAADLVAFDDGGVARAIATARCPVWTGVGHTGDLSLADEVAHTSFPTPTAAAQAIVERVETFELAVHERMRRVSVLARRGCDRATHDLERQMVAMPVSVERALAGARFTNRTQMSALTRAGGACVAQWRARLASRVVAYDGATQRLLADSRGALATRHAQVRVLDPYRSLARGYSIVRDESGAALTDAAAVAVGDHITVRLAMGQVRATVDAVEGVDG